MARNDAAQVSFRERYGPWAVVAGASEGIGESFARQLAAQGLGLVLLARRQQPLDRLAEQLQAGGTQVRSAAIDLTGADLIDQVRQATDDLMIGLLVYNAGATHGADMFLRRPVEHGLSLMQLNCRGPLLLTHHFGTRMAERGHGGIILVTSMSAAAGCARNAVYSGAKAFELIFAEGLWAELQPRGVDVVACVAGATRTPSLINAGARFESGGFSIMESADVAAEALAHIADGPTWVVGEDNRRIANWFWPAPRADLVRALSAGTAAMWG
jgi:short-subunit dehydrogenase